MSDRRDFFKLAAGSALLAAANPLSISNAIAAGGKSTPKKKNDVKPLKLNGNDLGKAMGLGGVPLAGGWIATSDEDSYKTLQEAWDLGIRYYDTSPRYGFGVSERRMGIFLDEKDPDEFIISTKVGRLLKPEKGGPAKPGIWPGRYNNVSVYDYTASGTRRSIEDSLQRLGVSQIDIAYIHDLSPDNGEIADRYDFYYNQAAKGAIPELAKMKKEGIIKAWGFGINRPDAALKSLQISDPDICLLATQYSLLDHEQALTETFPELAKRNVKIAVGSPLNCGYLAGNERWNYSGKPAPTKFEEKREKMYVVAKEHKVDLRTAALQFSMSHPIVTSVVVGARSPKQISEDFASLNGEKISSKFWADLKHLELIHKDAPTPS